MVDHDNYAADYTQQILQATKTIALVGASANAARPSYGVMQFLLARGYQVYPVNPGLAGQELLGQTVYESLAAIPVAIDMVDIFRNSDAVLPVVEEAISLPQKPKTIWMQLGVRNDDAAKIAEGHGLNVVMNRCPAIELQH
jgi:uncharacterized protein